MKLTKITILFLFIPILLFGQTTYYVSNQGDNGNNGTTPITAFLTVDHAASTATTAGDSILIFTGDEFREIMTVDGNGTPGNHIVFSIIDSATGLTGAAALALGDTATISGADLVNTWVDAGSNIYYNLGISTQLVQVWINESLAIMATKSENVGADSAAFWTTSGSDTLKIYTVMASDTSNIEISLRPYSIEISGKSYIIIDGLDVIKGGQGSSGVGDGIRVRNSSDNVIIQNCTLHDNWKNGVFVHASTNVTIQNSSAYNNTVNQGVNFWNASVFTANGLVNGVDSYSNGENGVLVENTDSVIIENCNFYQNTDEGIDIYGSDNITVRYCDIYESLDGTSGHGIYLDGNSLNFKVYYSLIHENNVWGIATTSGSEGAEIYNNVFYNNKENLVLKADTATVKNNIMLGPCAWGPQVNMDAGLTGISIDYNSYYNPLQWKIGGNTYNTLTAWQSATSDEASSLDSDPLFTDTANDDFTLQFNSPCIDKAFDWGQSQDYSGNSKSGLAWDIGAFEFYRMNNSMFLYFRGNKNFRDR